VQLHVRLIYHRFWKLTAGEIAVHCHWLFVFRSSGRILRTVIIIIPNIKIVTAGMAHQIKTRENIQHQGIRQQFTSSSFKSLDLLWEAFTTPGMQEDQHIAKRLSRDLKL
jgi:hypothetical protein